MEPVFKQLFLTQIFFFTNFKQFFKKTFQKREKLFLRLFFKKKKDYSKTIELFESVVVSASTTEKNRKPSKSEKAQKGSVSFVFYTSLYNFFKKIEMSSSNTFSPRAIVIRFFLKKN